MRILSAYLLLVLGGNDTPSVSDITSCLDVVGSKADKAQIEKVVSELKDKNINDLIATGFEKIKSVPSLGGGGGGSSSGGAASSASPAKGGKAEKEAEKEPEKEEESEADMGFSLFD